VASHGPVPSFAPTVDSVRARPLRPGWFAETMPIGSWCRPAGQYRTEAATASTATAPVTPVRLNCQAGRAFCPRSVTNNPVPSLTPVTASLVAEAGRRLVMSWAAASAALISG